jgi:hypothetical protein
LFLAAAGVAGFAFMRVLRNASQDQPAAPPQSSSGLGFTPSAPTSANLGAPSGVTPPVGTLQ